MHTAIIKSFLPSVKGGLKMLLSITSVLTEIITGYDNVKIDCAKIGDSTRSWFYSAQVKDYWGALFNAALSLRVP